MRRSISSAKKPVSFSAEQTIEALRVVVEEDVQLQVGFNRRFDPNFKKRYVILCSKEK
ncbi:hypothetical protein GCM10020331_083180 [Ectobacillus funiculus]